MEAGFKWLSRSPPPAEPWRYPTEAMHIINPSDYDEFFVLIRAVEVDESSGQILPLSPNTPCLQQWVDGVPCYPLFTSLAAALACASRAKINDLAVSCDRDTLRRILIEMQPMAVAFDPPHSKGLECEMMLINDFLDAIS